MSNIQIPSDKIHHPERLPSPAKAIGKLPVVVRDRIGAAQLPELYTKARTMLAEVVEAFTIDGAKFYADASEALAVAAKLYKDDGLALDARRLKLQAFRRMGELALQLRPPRARRTPEQDRAYRMAASKIRRSEKQQGIFTPKPSGSKNGAAKLLKEHGVACPHSVLQIARAPEKEFLKAVNEAHGISRASFAGRGLGENDRRASNEWNWLASSNAVARGGPQLIRVRGSFRSRPAREVAAGIAPGEVKTARALAVELMEWLDEFEQHLPKGC